MATGYSGYATFPDHTPWAAYAAVIVFVIGLVWPLIIEYRRLGRGFQKIETEFRSNRQREIEPPEQEVFSPHLIPQKPKRYRSPIRTVIICAALATILLGVDVVDFIVNRPSGTGPTDTISNF